MILTVGNWIWNYGGMILTVGNWVWSNGGMIETEGNKRTWREMCPIISLFTTNATQPGAGSNPGLHSDSLMTNCLSHDTVYKTVNLNVICIYVTWDYLQCTNKEQKSLNVVQNNFRI